MNSAYGAVSSRPNTRRFHETQSQKVPPRIVEGATAPARRPAALDRLVPGPLRRLDCGRHDRGAWRHDSPPRATAPVATLSRPQPEPDTQLRTGLTHFLKTTRHHYRLL